MRDSVFVAFCLIQYQDKNLTHNSNTITGQQREAIHPHFSNPELKVRHWGPMKGKRNESEIATTQTMLYVLFETGRIAHQFKHFSDAEGPPGPADAIHLNAQAVRDLATTG